ncbi:MULTISPECIES: UDPGP type 1 family protein [Paenibacillus]|uniref:UDPGP type 1 family protein n=1 Tax=Paenibacillus TaxID=44249 RepID=UPI0022B923FF|nr:UDPGP type 1 family protein [Paenibacillus caseinilyticus]MCZ8519928.1 UDPGP type 1 family protein [Paenibacillus caseinilyticus]
MSTSYEALKARAEAAGQEHLLRYYAELPEEGKAKLLEQISRLDMDRMARLFAGVGQPPELTGTMEPIEAVHWVDYSEAQQRQFEAAGWEALRQGQVGALVVAGGQGSRLGHEGPKGTYDIGLPSGKSLFQLQAERMLRLSRLAERTLPWYIMTSPENHGDTVRFFESHSYFGYPREDIVFFRQGVLPALDEEGRVLLSAKDEISFAPSGNGEVFASLKQSGALEDLKRRGVEWLFYYNVDNALIAIADPAFVGVAAHYNHPVATKVVEKSYPEEKVGILCRRNGRPAVVEYTDVPPDLMYERDSRSRYVYGLGNISIHLFRTDFIEKHAETDLPYHAAHKKIRTLDEAGEPYTPQEPNAYKFERFIFDFFPLMEEMTVLRMEREREFAPVKNKEGADSPATARELVLGLHKRWLLAAGVDPAALEGREIEISPLDSFGGEGLTEEVLRRYGLEVTGTAIQFEE